MSSDCLRTSDAIWEAARDGTELTEEQRRHVEHCGSCAEMLAEARAAVAALGCIRPCPPAPDCSRAVLSRIGRPGRVGASRRWAWALAPAAAAALFVVLYSGGPRQVVHRPGSGRPPAMVSSGKAQDGDGTSTPGSRKPLREGTLGERRLQPHSPPAPERTATAHPKPHAVPEKISLAGEVAKSEPSVQRQVEDLKTPPEEVVNAASPPLTAQTPLPASRPFHPGSPGCSPMKGLEALAEQRSEAQIAFRQKLQSKIDQIAALVHDISNGRSRLMMKLGASVNPVHGPLRMGEWGDLPLASIYPVSRPAEAELTGVGVGKVLGAAVLLGHARSDAYLLMASRTGSVLLLSAGTSDSGDTVYTEIARLALTNRTVGRSVRSPRVSLSEKAAGLTVLMEWPGEGYEFSITSGVAGGG